VLATAVVTEGRIVYEGELAELRRSSGERFALSVDDRGRALSVCSAVSGVTRSLGRGEVLGGKVLALLTYLAVAMTIFFVASTVSAVIAWGFHPLLNLSGRQLSAVHALALDVPALAIYCLPVLAIASFGIFLSVVTRQSVAAVGGTVIYAMALQGVAAITAIDAAHPFLLTNRFTAWHDLFQTPAGGAAILRSAWVCAAFALPPLVAAWIVFRRRDVPS
jgi:ABC-2 type transport system permease protein